MLQIEKHFLPEDHSRAYNEYLCFKDLLSDILLLTDAGKIEEAKQLSIDLTKSLHELSKMSEKKYDMDKLRFAMDMMREQGISIEVARRMYNNGLR